MVIPDNTNMDESLFVRRTINSSLIILLILLNVFAIVILNKDDARGYLAEIQAHTGGYSSALKQLDSIENEEKRTASRYDVACIMQDRSDYSQAAELFAQIDTYADSSSRYLSCRYSAADKLYESGSFDEALEIFSEIGDYSDAALRKNQVVYSKAEKAVASGEYPQAIMLFLSLDDYGDARQRALETATTVTGSSEKAEDLLNNGGLTGAEMEKSIRIAKLRATLPEFSIAAGNYHTVVLHKDGTVAACGDNSSGQCNVSEWRDIVQVHAGAKHTVGLKSNGTVVAVGDNSFGQCDVSEWADVKELAVNDYNTLALLTDGTVKNCGYNTYDTIERITEAAHVFAGGYAAAIVTDSGTYITSHKSHALQPGQRIIHATLNTGYGVVIQADGTGVFSSNIEDNWENMVWVDAGSTAVIGVDADGGIKSRFFRMSDKVEMPSDKKMLQCAAGTAHFVFLTSEGEVVAYGDNSMGQCDVEKLN